MFLKTVTTKIYPDNDSKMFLRNDNM